MPNPASPKKKSLLDRLPIIGDDDSPPHPSAIRRSVASLEAKLGRVKNVKDLLDKLGDQVEPALYTLLCEEKTSMRKVVDDALRNGTQSAIVVLIPLLIAQFALAPAVAAVVAGVVVKTLANKGQIKLCEDLREAREAKTRAKRKPAAKSKTARRKAKTAKKAR